MQRNWKEEKKISLLDGEYQNNAFIKKKKKIRTLSLEICDISE